MSQFIKDFRAKYPQYQDVADDQLVSALHTKYYSDMPVEQFNRRIGYEPPAQQPVEQQPIEQQQVELQDVEVDGFTGAARKVQPEQEYDTFIESTGKSIRNVPERFQQSAAGLIQLLGEDMSQAKERHINIVSNRLGITPSDYRLLAWAGNEGLVDPKTPIPEALEYVKRNVTGALNEQQLKQVADMGIINPEELSGFAQYWREETKKTMEPVKAEPGSATYYTSAAIGSVAEMGPALLGSIVTRNPSVGMRIMAGQVGGQSYAEGREQGLSPDEAQFYALANAAAEAIPEYVPISVIIKPGQNFFKRVLKGAAAESAQEVLTEAIQLGLDKEMIKPDMTWEEARQRLIDAGIIGGIAGPMMSTVTHPVVKVQEKVDQALNTPERQLAKALNESIETTQLAPTDQAAVEALSPERAQIKQPQDMSMSELVADKLAQKQTSQAQQEQVAVDSTQVTEPEKQQQNQQVTVDQVVQDDVEIDKAAPQEVEQAAVELVEDQQNAGLVERSLPEQSDQQERSVTVDETERAGREVESERIDTTAEPTRSGEQVAPVGTTVTESAPTLEHKGIKVNVPEISQELVDGYNRSTHLGKGRDLNQEQQETAKSIIDDLEGSKYVIDTPEQKAEASALIDQHMSKVAEFNRWNAQQAINNPSWLVTGRSGRNMAKANAKAERTMNEYAKRVDVLERDRKAIKRKLYEMRPAEVKQKQQQTKNMKDIADYVGQVSTYLQEGKQAVAKDNRKWAIPKALKAVEASLESDRAGTIEFLKKMDEKLSDLGGFVKVVGPRSKLGKLYFELSREQEAKTDEKAKPEEKAPAQPEKKTEAKPEQQEITVSDYGENAVDSFKTFQASIADKSATVDQIKSDAENLIANKDKVIKELSAMRNSDVTKMFKFPKRNMRKDKLVQSAWEVMLYSHVLKSGAVTTFEGSQTLEDLVMKQVNEQTKLDIEKAYDNGVAEPTMNRKGEITYPSPKEDVNTKQYNKRDTLAYEVPKEGERVFHAPGHNYIGLFRSTGIPERREFVTIEGRKLKIPDKPQRIEPIMRKLVQIAGRRIYFGKIKGKSAEGFYRPNVGEIRTRRKNDVEVLAHELAHYLDVYSNISLPDFQKVYKDPKYVKEVEALSYTDADPKIQKIEGFAEFVRLWLTNANEAQSRAPKFYDAFTKTLARDRKLLNPMRDMQDLMHKFYFQGPDKLGQALIGKDTSFIQAFEQWKYRRDSRIRQQVIDRFHAARKVEQELSRKIGTVQESAWKQFRLANGGAEGISDYIMNYGTVQFDEKGDLKRNGASLHEVLAPVKTIDLKQEHQGEQKIDLLMRYFAGRRALELHRQKRENLIPKETAKEWARLGKDYPVFESIHKEYQAFNDRMMDFYQEAGMITPEGRKAMQSMNKDYVPFNRIRDQLAGGSTASSGFKKLKGGTANLNDILVNIQDGVTANVRAALNNRAKQRLYQYISSHKDGAIFATKIAPDSRKVQVYADEMKAKIGKVLEINGIELEGDIDLATKGLLEFWQHGVTPKVNESGNIVDSVIINGKPKYYEVQDPLLQEMLLSMNPESYSSFMNVMFGVKNFFTRMITLGVEFTGANLVRDTTGAAFLSKNNFKPFVDSFKGMYSFITKDKYYQDFLRSGGGYSSRLEATTKEGTARRRVAVDEFGIMTIPERLLSSIDNIASAFEYGTRIGEFRLAKKNMKSDMDAGFDAREISTDFSVLGANRFLTGYIRTVPFLNAMIQSQDRVFREAVVSKKYDGNPTGLAMKAFLGITVPTLILYLVNKDDEDYQEIPDYEKRTNWHIKIGDGEFIKIPRPYDVGFVYATMPELFAKYIEDDKGKEFADGMLWTLTQMYGIDGTPAMMTGWWDLVRNEKWTGAPVVPHSLSDVEAPEQYTSNTSETFVRLGEALGVSPVKAEHMFKSYTGYLGGYLLWGTDHMLWDEEKFGEKPDRKASDNVFLRRFLTPDVRPATAAMEKFFDLKEKSDRVVATFRQTVDVRRQLAERGGKPGKFKDDRFFGLSAKEKEVLFALNDSMNQLIKVMYGKEGIKTAELKIKYDRNLTGAEKREQLDQLWLSRNKAFMQYYNQANQALQKAKREAEQEK